MKVKQNQNTIKVTIEEDATTFYYFKSLIDKNFHHKIGQKNKIIIFNDSDEEVQRKYFLKLLSRIYARKSGKKLKKIWQIEKATDKIIKISFLKTNQIQQIVNMHIKYDKNSNMIEINLKEKNRLILRVFKNIFSDYKMEYQPLINSVFFSGIDIAFLNILKKFIHTREIFGVFINADYDPHIFEDISKYSTKATTRKRKVGIILDDFYKKLHCTFDDPYDKVRKNYLSLVKKYHPDNIKEDNEIILKVFRKKFQEIQQAYKTIKEYHRYTTDAA